MSLNLNDWIGFAGVAILLLAFLLNLLKKISTNSLPYIIMNFLADIRKSLFLYLQLCFKQGLLKTVFHFFLFFFIFSLPAEEYEDDY